MNINQGGLVLNEASVNETFTKEGANGKEVISAQLTPYASNDHLAEAIQATRNESKPIS